MRSDVIQAWGGLGLEASPYALTYSQDLRDESKKLSAAAEPSFRQRAILG